MAAPTPCHTQLTPLVLRSQKHRTVFKTHGFMVGVYMSRAQPHCAPAYEMADSANSSQWEWSVLMAANSSIPKLNALAESTLIAE